RGGGPLGERLDRAALPARLRVTGQTGERVARFELARDVRYTRCYETRLGATSRGRDRDERERECGALSQALVRGRVRRGGQTHGDDQLTGPERQERPVVRGRRAVQLEERQLACARRRAELHDPAGRGERRRQVGRVGRDAVAGLEVVPAVVADLRVAGLPAAEPAVP